MNHPLAEVQSFFARAIQGVSPVEAQPGGKSFTPQVITGNARLSPTDQLEIYREQFWLRHVGAMQEDFPTVERLVGHEAFHTLVERYLESFPSAAFSLRDLGAHFERFLSTVSPYAQDPLLAECARFEWAFVEAFDAPDAEPVTPELIARLPEDAWPNARVTLHPALQLVSVGYRLDTYRAAVRANEDAPRPDPSPARIAVYRGAEKLHYVELEPSSFDLLVRLRAGEPLGAACEAVAAGLAGRDGEAELEAKIGGWFQYWAAAGWLAGIEA